MLDLLKAAALTLVLLPFAAWATDPPKSSPVTATAAASAEASAGGGDATANGGDASNGGVHVESERQAPSTFTVAPQSTAPCYYSNGWSVGVPGAGGGRSKARKDAECWAEYVKQAEHERAVDAANLAIEREKLAIERDRLKLESERLSICHECAVSK